MLHRVAIHTRIVATRKSRAVHVHAETAHFFRVWASLARVSIVFTSGRTSAEVFHVRVLPSAILSAINGKLIILYGIERLRKILIT